MGTSNTYNFNFFAKNVQKIFCVFAAKTIKKSTSLPTEVSHLPRAAYPRRYGVHL